MTKTMTKVMTGKEKMRARALELREQAMEQARIQKEKEDNAVGVERMIYDMMKKQKEQEKKRQELEEKVRQAKSAEAETFQQLRYLRGIQAMAGYTTPPSMKWEVEDREIGYGYADKYVWKKAHNLRTAQLDAYISIAERKDLKKMKYEVTVSGSFTKADTGYANHDAIKKLVQTWQQLPNSTSYGYVQNEGAPGIIEKFKSVEEAESFVKTWKDLINKGFAKEIKEDRKLLKLALASK